MNTERIFQWDVVEDTLVVTLMHSASSLADAEIRAELEELQGRLGRGGVPNVVFDFGAVKYFGSSMLEALQRLNRNVENCGGKMALCNLSEVGNEVLRVTRFDMLWPVRDTRQEALEAVHEA